MWSLSFIVGMIQLLTYVSKGTYSASYLNGRDHFGGTVLMKSKVVRWRAQFTITEFLAKYQLPLPGMEMI
jgi:hypothetical protein